jgi:hypothetical protein
LKNFPISLKFLENRAGLPPHTAVFRKFAVEFRKETSNIALCRIICFRTVEKPVLRLLIRFGTQVTKTYINGNGVGNADFINIGLLSIREHIYKSHCRAQKPSVRMLQFRAPRDRFERSGLTLRF